MAAAPCRELLLGVGVFPQHKTPPSQSLEWLQPPPPIRCQGCHSQARLRGRHAHFRLLGDAIGGKRCQSNPPLVPRSPIGWSAQKPAKPAPVAHWSIELPLLRSPAFLPI